MTLGDSTEFGPSAAKSPRHRDANAVKNEVAKQAPVNDVGHGKKTTQKRRTPFLNSPGGALRCRRFIYYMQRTSCRNAPSSDPVGDIGTHTTQRT